MTILFKIDDFLFKLFPVDRNNPEQLKEYLHRYYTVGPFEPAIEVSDGLVKIQIDTDRISADKASYERLISLCEKGLYTEAKPLVRELISKSPNVSEYHRILGQMLSDEGDQDEAINCLIDALRWNPKNEGALLMMGNIFAKFKKDIPTALAYYDQVLLVKPDDHIALNNIGANLMKLDRLDEAVPYFNRAIAINPEYPNTHYALALTLDQKGDIQGAFNSALKAVELNPQKDGLFNMCLKLAIETARKLVVSIEEGHGIVQEFISELENKCGKTIRVEIDEEISTAAKIEFAENYNRDYHLVKYKSSYPSSAHLVMHELMHLELATEARTIDENQLFTTNQSLKSQFIFSLGKFAEGLRKKGIQEEYIAKYFQALFDGINLQVYNTPIDLFIEDRIYHRYPEMLPVQFLSLFTILQQNIGAVTRPEIVDNTPALILSKSKIYNLINALHFNTLFKVDFVYEHKPTKSELDQANELYNEYLEYRHDKEPGEEYELVQHWAEDLKLDAYFELVPESNHRLKSVDEVIAEIEADPYGLNTKDPSMERKIKKFLNSHTSSEINTAVAMYMVGAIELFKSFSQSRVKEMAFEFATLGMSGIDPNKDGYSIPSIKNKTFTGYQALSYYYVSWAIAIPEMLAQLQMPFDKEYELAKQMAEL